MVDILERPSVDFQEAAASAATRQSVTVNLDADVLQFLRAEGLNLDENINGLLRFYMDTSQQKEREFQPDAWEPGEMQTPLPTAPAL